MEYLLILFVLAVALAPLSHFFPSKRQRQQANMREKAALAGLFVEFRQLPEGATQRQAGRRQSGQVIYYGKRLPPARGKPRKRLAWLPSEQAWRGLGHREPAPAMVASLPAGALAASIDEGSCGVYWQERGEEGDAEQIITAVKAWTELIGSDRRVTRATPGDDFS